MFLAYVVVFEGVCAAHIVSTDVGRDVGRFVGKESVEVFFGKVDEVATVVALEVGMGVDGVVEVLAADVVEGFGVFTVRYLSGSGSTAPKMRVDSQWVLEM